MNGFTKCPHCLQVARVADGKLVYHVRVTWSNKACEGFKTDAKWVEKKAIMAFGRNSKGECMRCWETETNPECPQCCYEKYHSA